MSQLNQIDGSRQIKPASIPAGQLSFTPLQASNYVANEAPTGTQNGTNLTFTLANTPLANTVILKLNGLVEVPGASGSYTVSGATITFNSGLAPIASDVITVSYFH